MHAQKEDPTTKGGKVKVPTAWVCIGALLPAKAQNQRHSGIPSLLCNRWRQDPENTLEISRFEKGVTPNFRRRPCEGKTENRAHEAFFLFSGSSQQRSLTWPEILATKNCNPALTARSGVQQTPQQSALVSSGVNCSVRRNTLPSSKRKRIMRPFMWAPTPHAMHGWFKRQLHRQNTSSPAGSDVLPAMQDKMVGWPEG